MIAVPSTFTEFLAASSLSLGIKGKRVFNCHGGEIHDILFIRYHSSELVSVVAYSPAHLKEDKPI